MRALVCHELSTDRSGTKLEADWPEPAAPGPGEVTVAMTAAALNYPDLLMLSGGYQFKPELPFIPGVEGAGHIVAVGEDVSGELIGERVVVGARSGCLAERITLSLASVRSLPPGMHDEQAAGFTVGALTAWVGLVERGRLAVGERVLVLGAGGGMGWAAVQLAHARGATVLAATSDPAKAALLTGAGADMVLTIDRATPRFRRPEGYRRGVRSGWRRARHAGAEDAALGRPLSDHRLYRRAAGAGAAQPRAAQGHRDRWRAGPARQGGRDAGAGARHLREIDALAAGGKLTPHIGLTVPLERADEAFAAMAAGAIMGKAVVTF